MNSNVQAGVPSDPRLMAAYDQKAVMIKSSNRTEITLEVVVDGTNFWIPYKTFQLEPDSPLNHEFPTGLSAYWVRATSQSDSTVTVQFTYM